MCMGVGDTLFVTSVIVCREFDLLRYYCIRIMFIILPGVYSFVLCIHVPAMVPGNLFGRLSHARASSRRGNWVESAKGDNPDRKS